MFTFKYKLYQAIFTADLPVQKTTSARMQSNKTNVTITSVITALNTTEKTDLLYKFHQET